MIIIHNIVVSVNGTVINRKSSGFRVLLKELQIQRWIICNKNNNQVYANF